MIKYFLSMLLLSTAAVADDFLQMREYRGNLCYDGDTCYVLAPSLPESLQKMSIRILGIDTPEIRGACTEEKELALEGREVANNLFRNAEKIEFRGYKWDKYGGRILTEVYLDDQNYAELLMMAGLARPYYGGTKTSWCD
jgi:endonuclease YncB( thermonuclease family)